MSHTTITTLALTALVLAASPPSSHAKESRRPATTLAAISASFEELAAIVNPSVVKIYSTGPGKKTELSPSPKKRQQSSGSGVIVAADGYIITNAHVVASAARIQVVLAHEADPKRPLRSILKGTGRVLDARIVGIDLETDIALLAIDRKNLPSLPFADSDEVRPGQLVLAFGSPLGLENSVTMGVVSASVRQLEPDDPMIYIQTDAPINPGSSGGPLVNASGQVIGINTLIFSLSGGSDGIGFAAPSNIVKNVYLQLREEGRVRRGMIGVHAQTITTTLARGLGLDPPHGVILGDVSPDGPAAVAGLRVGDIVLTLGAKTMENGRQFNVNLYRRRVGTVVSIEVLRDGRRLTFPVTVLERPNDSSRFTDLVSTQTASIAKLGIIALDLTEQVRRLLPELRHDEGVVVARPAPPTAITGEAFEGGDVIYSVNRERVTDIASLQERLENLETGDALAVHVERNGSLRFLSLEVQ